MADAQTSSKTIAAWNTHGHEGCAPVTTLEGVIAGVRGIAVAIQTAIEDVRAHAAEAHTDVSARSSPLDDPQLLHDAIAVAEVSKVAILEAEALLVDTVLESLINVLSECTPPTGAIEELPAKVAALPRLPVEPTRISFIPNESLGGIVSRISAPRGVRAGDVTLRVGSRVCRGGVAVFDVALSDAHPAHQYPSEIDATLVSLLQHVQAFAELETRSPGQDASTWTTLQPLVSSVSVRQAERCVRISVAVPAALVSGLSAQDKACQAVVLRSVSIAGTPVISDILPAKVPLSGVPLSISRLDGYHVNAGMHSPVVDLDGIIYVPDAESSRVQRFGADGSRLAPLPVPDLLSPGDPTYQHMGLDEVTDTLFVSGDSAQVFLIAIDLASGATRWVVPRANHGDVYNSTACCGIGVLPSHGVLVSGSNRLVVHDIATGAVIHELDTGYPQSLTADPVGGRVFACINRKGLMSFSWDARDRALVDSTAVAPPGKIPSFEPFCPGGGFFSCTTTVRVSDALPACLVLASRNVGKIAVLTLPELRWAFSHDAATPGRVMNVGIAADLAGSGKCCCWQNLSIPWLPG